jgi:glucose-6-phosphate isomerase
LRLKLGAFERVHRDALERLVRERAVDRLWAGDAALGKKDESKRASIQNSLGWLSLPERMEPGSAELASFAEGISREADRVLVVGARPVSLAPLVFARSFRRAAGRPALEVLDAGDPSGVLEVVGRCDRARTIFVLSSKSGTDLEPGLVDAIFDRVGRAVAESAGNRVLVITGSGSDLEKKAAAWKARRVFPGDPQTDERYGALSNFGLVPAALGGVDVFELLQRARKMAELCRRDAPGNPGAILGSAMAALAMKGRDKLTLSVGRPVESLGLWAQGLIDESVGAGIRSVDGEALERAADYGGDRFFVRIDVEGKDNTADRDRLSALAAEGHPTVHYELSGALDLGAEMFRWEFATVVAGVLLGIDPFGPPEVRETGDRTGASPREGSR